VVVKIGPRPPHEREDACSIASVGKNTEMDVFAKSEMLSQLPGDSTGAGGSVNITQMHVSQQVEGSVRCDLRCSGRTRRV
jgi:hypothetical protein